MRFFKVDTTKLGYRTDGSGRIITVEEGRHSADRERQRRQFYQACRPSNPLFPESMYRGEQPSPREERRIELPGQDIYQQTIERLQKVEQ